MLIINKLDKKLKKEIKKFNRKIDYNKNLIFSKKDLISYLSYWSIKLSPKNIPDNLERVLNEFEDHIYPYFNKLDKSKLGYMDMNLKQLQKFLYGNLITIDKFKEWNLSEMEKKLNTNINDNRIEYNNKISCEKIDKLYDIVDLYAIITNISLSIYDMN